jgi:hypothetical protein
MKRLCTLLSLIALLTVLALPAIARADDAPPPPEQSQPVTDPSTDGWTWDEAAPADPAASADPAPANQGGTTDGWTWDEV